MTIDLNNNRHAVAVWAFLTFTMAGFCFTLVGLTGHFAPAQAIATDSGLHPVHAMTFDACAYFDKWGDVECLQADHEGRPTDVTTYEDGSQVAHRAWAGFAHNDTFDVWTACMPDAACDDSHAK